MHPGGELFVKAFSGRDATEAFLSYHRRSFPHSIMTKHLVNSAVPLKDKEIDKDYLGIINSNFLKFYFNLIFIIIIYIYNRIMQNY